MRCTRCAGEGIRGAQWCRYCGSDVARWQKKRGIILWVLILAVLGFFSLFLYTFILAPV